MRSALVLLSLSMAAAWAASTPHEALLVLSKGNHTLAIVDPVSLKVVATAPSGEDPHEVVASSDGKFAYISNYGFGSFNTLTVIDLVGQKSAKTIDLGALRGPHGLMYAGGKVWFTAEAAKAIGSYDPAKGSIDFIMGTGQDRTHMIIVSDDGKRILTSNVSSASVSVFEQVKRPQGPPPPPPGSRPWSEQPPVAGVPSPTGIVMAPQPPRGPMPNGFDWQQTVIGVGRGAEGFDTSPNGKELWAANAQDGTISIIDLASRKVTATLRANVPGANRLKFTPDGELVFVTSLGVGGVAIISTTTHEEVKRILKDARAAGIQMQPDGSHAYIACTGNDYVAVVDLKTLAVTGKIDAGPEPDGLAWSVLK